MPHSTLQHRLKRKKDLDADPDWVAFFESPTAPRLPNASWGPSPETCSSPFWTGSTSLLGLQQLVPTETNSPPDFWSGGPNDDRGPIAVFAETLAQTADDVVQIVSAAGQQVTGIAQVNDAIEEIEQVTYQHAEAIRQVEQAARELVAISTQLTGLTAPLMPSDLSVTFTSPSERVEFNT